MRKISFINCTLCALPDIWRVRLAVSLTTNFLDHVGVTFRRRRRQLMSLLVLIVTALLMRLLQDCPVEHYTSWGNDARLLRFSGPTSASSIHAIWYRHAGGDAVLFVETRVVGGG